MKKGQSLVEYIMMLLMVALMVLGIMKSNAFKKFFSSEQDGFFTKMRQSYEYNYRFCGSWFPRRIGQMDRFITGYSGTQHDCYFSSKDNPSDSKKMFYPQKYDHVLQ